MKVLLAFAVLCISGSFAASTNTSGVVFCYYGEWANLRPGNGRFGVSDLPTDLCTHIVYSFLSLNGTTGGIIAPSTTTYEGKSNSIADLVALKAKNSELKIIVAIGGWNEASTNFTAVVNNDTLRATLVSNLYNYVNSNGFDGLDLDWEYPAQRGGADTDKEAFVTFVKELKEAFTAKSYLLTAAVAVTQANIDLSYNVTELNKYLDYFNLMLYDFHGTWDSVTGVVAPLYAQLTDDADLNLNVNSSVHIWLNNGATASKLVLGLAAYGKTFTLTSLNNTSTGAPFTAAGVAGPYLQEAGSWGYNEICENQTNNSTLWSITEVTGNYVYANKDLFWVGYDNPNTIKAKAQYAKTMGLGGIMYWAVDEDDFNGLCGEKFPLINAGIEGFNSA